MHDHIARAMAVKGKIRAVACVTTKLANDICFLQGTSPIASIALGRALSGAALVGSTLKQGQRMALKFEGSGPLKKLITEVEWDGAIRGTVAVPDAVAESVPAALGRAGFLTVSKDLGMKDPYSGTVQLCTSEIAEDLAYYLTDSEQTPSAIGLGVSLSPDGQISAAGGFMIQSLPPSDLVAVEKIMAAIAKLPAAYHLCLQMARALRTCWNSCWRGGHHPLESTDCSYVVAAPVTRWSGPFCRWARQSWSED